MLTRILQLLHLACNHGNISHPFTAAQGSRASRTSEWESVGQATSSHYVVCLECGRKFEYDWNNMRMVQ